MDGLARDARRGRLRPVPARARVPAEDREPEPDHGVPGGAHLRRGHHAEDADRAPLRGRLLLRLRHDADHDVTQSVKHLQLLLG